MLSGQKCSAPILFLLMLSLILCGCDAKNKTYFYRATDLTLYNGDNGGKLPVDAASDSVAAIRYAIRMEFTTEVYRADDRPSNIYENHYTCTNEPTNFIVYSLTDFDAAHPAMTSLNDCFYHLIYNYSGFYYVDSTAIQNIRIPSNINRENVVFNTPLKASDHIVMFKQPAILGNRTFVIDITYSDNHQSSDTITVNLF